TGVARVFGRAVEPGLVAGFAALRNRAEGPQMRAGPHVVTAHVALQIGLRRWPHRDVMGGPDDGDVADDHCRGTVADARVVVDFTAHADHQVDEAALAETGNGLPVPRIE